MIRRLATVLAPLLVAVFLPLVASSTAHAADGVCADSSDVPLVIEFGSLEGADRILCAQNAEGKTALQALTDLGVEVNMSSGTPPMVCRIEGVPTAAEEKCGQQLSGDGYWALMVASEGHDWDYAAVGLADLPLGNGDFIALKYHLLADGMEVPIDAAADATTREQAIVPAIEPSAVTPDGDSAAPQIAIGVVLAILVIGGVVLALSRRQGKQ